MQDITKVIENYLSVSSEYAIQLSGDWGTGKTYYYKNEIEKNISEKGSIEDNSKKYKPIYISMFGLKSIEDIQTKIVFEFFQTKVFGKYLKSRGFKKGIRITQGILNIGFRGFINFNKLGNTNDYYSDIKSIGNNVLDTHELVICLDDMERKHSQLEIADVTGYINTLVDEGVKVIIISNDDKIKEDSYKDFKEKIIGIKVEYVPNLETTLKNIIKARYISFPNYSKYLLANIDNLIKVTKAINNNFRHIIYALDNVQVCYSSIRKSILDLEIDIEDKVSQELNNILNISICFSIEYKASVISHKDAIEFNKDHIFFNQVLNQDNSNLTEDDSKSKFEKFIEKYNIDSTDYHFYKSIFNYTTRIEDFNIEDFIKEFKAEFKLEKGITLPEYEILNSLGYQNCFNLSDKEYKEKTLQAIEFAESGKYTPTDYLTLMHFVERFNNLEKFNIEEILNRLIKGIKLSIAKVFDNHYASSQFKMSGTHQSISDNVKRLYDVGLDEFKTLRNKKDAENINKMGQLLLTDTSKFQTQYQSDPNFNYNVDNTPFLNYIVPAFFIEKLKVMPGQEIYFITDIFKTRYNNNIDMVSQESQHLSQIIILLQDYCKEIQDRLRIYIIDELISILQKSIAVPQNSN